MGGAERGQEDQKILTKGTSIRKLYHALVHTLMCFVTWVGMNAKLTWIFAPNQGLYLVSESSEAADVWVDMLLLSSYAVQSRGEEALAVALTPHGAVKG